MRNHGRLLAITGLLVLNGFLPASAQVEDLMQAPPPPPMGLPGPNTNSDDSAVKPDGETLKGDRKERFAKAAIEDITDENFPETIDSFDFPNADIQDIVKAISELTGKNFIIDPGVRGKITIIAPSKITVAEAYKAFLSALAINGYAVVPSGAFYKIRTARNAQRDGIETYAGTYYPSADQMVTKIFHLKHINAEIVNRELRMLQSKDGELSIYPPTNSLLISDYGSNIDRISRILAQLDVPGFEDQLEVIRVRYAKAKDMAELIMKIINKGEQPQRSQGGAFTAGVPRFGRAGAQTGNQGSAYFMVIPDDRTNSLIVTGNKAGFDRIKRLLAQLDRRLDPGEGGGVHVYYVKYGDAEKIAQTLSGIAKEGAPKATAGAGPGAAPAVSPVTGVQATSTEIFGGDVKITADKGTNSLVIIASKPDYETVLSLLRKIDIQRDQVYVEAIIMELSANDSMDYQIGYFNYIGNTGARAGFNGIDSTTLQGLISPTGGQGVILPFGDPNSTVTITPINPTGGASTPITIPSLMGFINFLKKNVNGNVLSTPSILTLDAQEGKISIGDRVVVGTTQSAPAAGQAAGFVTPQFEDANIELNVKPFISAEDRNIRMELKASVKQLSTAKTPKGLQDTTQPLATRSIETNILVHHGDTAVLGGLMKEDEFETINKVPLLGDIPILGWLFKSRNLGRSKTNLLMFLTPKIIHSQEDSRRLLSRKAEERLRFIKKSGGQDPFGEKMDEIMGVQTGKLQGDGVEVE